MTLNVHPLGLPVNPDNLNQTVHPEVIVGQQAPPAFQVGQSPSVNSQNWQQTDFGVRSDFNQIDGGNDRGESGGDYLI